MKYDSKTAENIDRHTIEEKAVLSRIQAAMQTNGIKRSDITEGLGIHNTSFAKWISGKSSSYIKHINTIADILGVPVGYLLHGVEEYPDANEAFAGLDGRGISNTELASRLGISPASIYSWRSKKSIPSKHMDSIMVILKSTDTLPVGLDKTGTWKRLKGKGISKPYLSQYLGVSKATVYRWKEDHSIPDKYMGEILKLLEDEPRQAADEQPEPIIYQGRAGSSIEHTIQDDEAGSGESFAESMDISVFMNDISEYIEGELKGLSQQEQEYCLADLNLSIRLSLKRIKLMARASTVLNL